MKTRRMRSMAIVAFAITALTIGLFPGFAASPTHHYLVATIPDHIRPGHSLMITATINEGASSCDYKVVLTVKNPDGVPFKDTIAIKTGPDGSGFASALFPDDFKVNPATDETGKYTVIATFTCGYTTGAASTTFTVREAAAGDNSLA